MKRCVYCRKIVEEESIDFCESCGTKICGDKMFRAIVENARKAKERGDI